MQIRRSHAVHSTQNIIPIDRFRIESFDLSSVQFRTLIDGTHYYTSIRPKFYVLGQTSFDIIKLYDSDFIEMPYFTSLYWDNFFDGRREEGSENFSMETVGTTQPFTPTEEPLELGIQYVCWNNVTL
jgi:hypothetical protein